MKITSKAHLQAEMFRLQTVFRSQQHVEMNTLVRHYTAQLSCPPSERSNIGFLTLYSPNISFHIASLHVLLDCWDSMYDGRRFHKAPAPNQLFLYNDLLGQPSDFNHNISDMCTQIRPFSTPFRHATHIFCLPVLSPHPYLTRITPSSNIVVVFASSPADAVLHGLGEIYLQKYLRHLPPNFKTPQQFAEAFASGAIRL